MFTALLASPWQMTTRAPRSRLAGTFRGLKTALAPSATTISFWPEESTRIMAAAVL
jgi:hypothetical protein